jgi:hypothetical protein
VETKVKIPKILKLETYSTILERIQYYRTPQPTRTNAQLSFHFTQQLKEKQAFKTSYAPASTRPKNTLKKATVSVQHPKIQIQPTITDSGTFRTSVSRCALKQNKERPKDCKNA